MSTLLVSLLLLSVVLSAVGGRVRFDGETTSIMLCKMTCGSADDDENLTKSSEVDFGERPNRFNDSPTWCRGRISGYQYGVLTVISELEAKCVAAYLHCFLG